MPKVSVTIITLNEAEHIGAAIDSAAWADEIVIVDSGSTDATISICKEFTDKIFSHEFRDYSDQKNYALSQTGGDWCLSLDADEAVTGPLKAEILDIIARTRMDGYHIPRGSWIFGRRMHYSGTQDDRPLRLFRRGKARFTQPIHETVRLDGPAGTLKNPLEHYTYPDVGGYLERLNRYTGMEAEWMKVSGRKARLSDMLLRPPAKFIQLYCIKQGFRDGYQGFLFSALSAWYVLVKYAKLREARERTA